MGLKPINMICPNCRNGNYMRLLDFKNVGRLDVKCINCNRYFNYAELCKKEVKSKAIPAIPVEWLEEQRDKLSEAWDYEWHVINGLIEQWQEEQEEKNESYNL